MQSSMVRLAVGMSALMIAAIVALEIFHPGDNAVAIGHVLTIGIPTTAALLALVRSTETLNRSTENSQRINDLHEAVNGQAAERERTAHAAGRREARRERESPE